MSSLTASHDARDARLVPAAGALRVDSTILRGFTMLVFAASFVLSLQLLATPMTAGWHHQYATPWIEALGIRYHVAVDGISLWLVVLTTFTTPIALYASFGSIKTRIKELCFAFLLSWALLHAGWQVESAFRTFIWFCRTDQHAVANRQPECASRSAFALRSG